MQQNPQRELSRVKQTGSPWSNRRPPSPPWEKGSRLWRWLRSKMKTLRTHRTGK